MLKLIETNYRKYRIAFWVWSVKKFRAKKTKLKIKNFWKLHSLFWQSVCNKWKMQKKLLQRYTHWTDLTVHKGTDVNSNHTSPAAVRQTVCIPPAHTWTHDAGSLTFAARLRSMMSGPRPSWPVSPAPTTRTKPASFPPTQLNMGKHTVHKC